MVARYAAKKRVVRRKAMPNRKGRRPLGGPTGRATFVRAAGTAAAAGMAVYRGGSKTVTQTKSQPNIAGGGAYNQWSSFGFKKTFGALTRTKLDKLSQRSLTIMWRQMGNLGSGQGNMLMNNWMNDAAPTSNRGVPVYAFELNCCPNVSNSGTTTNANPMLVPIRDTNNKYIWSYQTGQTYTASASSAWNIERSADLASIVDTFPGAMSILKWADVRMDLYGCKSQPTKFTIELCQFDEEIMPFAGTSNTASSRFWDQQLRSYVYNPNLSQISSGNIKGKRVLARKEVHIDPTSTTESDSNPHVRTLKFFWRFNRLCKYDWQDSIGNTESAVNTLYDGVSAPSATGDNQTQVQPKARLYLLIRATKWVQSVDYASQTTVDTPSMNLQVRCKHIINT